MRFVKREMVISSVVDKEIEDKEEIRDVLKNLFEFHVEFSFGYKKFFPSDYETRTFSYKKVRIDKIYEDKEEIDVIIFNNKTKTRLKSINFENIVYINAITNKENLLKSYNDFNRFDFLDISDSD